MSAETVAALLPLPEPAAAETPPAHRPPSPQHTRTVTHACVLIGLCALLTIYTGTASSMVGLWLRSATFAHGFLIAPISAWLIWRQRGWLAHVPCRPFPLALLPLAGLGALWLLSNVANVQVLQQYCLILMCITFIVATMGVAYTRAIAFPLLYLLLAVPFGEIFVPPLIDFTARFTVTLLQLGGIPVFRENNFISLPTGNWSVVDACSGLRYVIASLALGMIYAYLTYRSPLRRLFFIAVSLILPVIANGLRACMIVLIGHWSHMTLAVGIDHLIYGWLFFGLISASLFWCGGHWRETEPAPPHPSPAMPFAPSASLASLVRITIAALAVAAIWPVAAMIALRPAPPDLTPEPQLALAPPPLPWRISPMTAADWHMLHEGHPQRVSANYSDGNRTVSLQLTVYRHQVKGSELLAPVRRVVVPGLPRWIQVSEEQRAIRIGQRHFNVRQSVEQAAGGKLLVWRWYRQAGADTSSPQLLKLMLARSKLFGGDDGGAEIVLASAYDEQPEPAAAAMQTLLEAMLPAIDQGLHHAAQR